MPKEPRLPKAPDPTTNRHADHQHKPRDPSSPVEIAQYIAEFSGELSSLARQSQLDLLAYLLDMARLEATRVAESGPDAP